MKHIWLGVFTLLAAPAWAQSVTFVDKDGYAMGPGTWTCEKAISIALEDGGSDKSALIGWILGAWSFSTFAREPAYSDVIEDVGGQAIYVETIRRCQSAPPDELLHVVVRAMVDNTAAD